MGTLRLLCIKCGEVEVAAQEVLISTCVSTGYGTSSFRCPQCGVIIIKPVEPRTAALLRAGGCSQKTWTMPAETGESFLGPPVSYDDLIDAHALVASPSFDTALAELLAG